MLLLSPEKLLNISTKEQCETAPVNCDPFTQTLLVQAATTAARNRGLLTDGYTWANKS